MPSMPSMPSIPSTGRQRRLPRHVSPQVCLPGSIPGAGWSTLEHASCIPAGTDKTVRRAMKATGRPCHCEGTGRRVTMISDDDRSGDEPVTPPEEATAVSAVSAERFPDPAVLTNRQRRILEMIRREVAEKGYPPSLREIGEAVGLRSPSSIAHQLKVLESKGFVRRDPNRPRAIELRPTTVQRWFDEALGEMPLPEPIYVPVLGRIAAGSPVLAEQVVEDVFPLPSALVGHGELFLLRVSGDSMTGAGIYDKDWVVVRRQPTAEPGAIVAALIDGEATVKTLLRRGRHVWLLPQNPAYPPIPGEEASILGQVTAVLRSL